MIAEIETDKATMEVEAVDEGVVEALLVPEGTEEVKVNAPIAAAERGRGLPPPEGRRRGGAKRAASGRRAGSRAAAAAPRPRRARPRAAAEPPPRPASRAEPDVPAGAKLVKITVRDALRDAMAEEMRRDPDVFLMGEEVAAVPGRLQGQPRPAAGVRRPAGDRHPDHRARLRRPRRRRGDGRA